MPFLKLNRKHLKIGCLSEKRFFQPDLPGSKQIIFKDFLWKDYF